MAILWVNPQYLCGTTDRGPLILGVRPEQIEIGDTGIELKTVYGEDLGSHSIIVATCPDGQEVRIAKQLGAGKGIPDRFKVRFPEGSHRYFDAKSGKRLQ